MSIKQKLDIFSRRRPKASPRLAAIPEESRARIMMLCTDVCEGCGDELWSDIHRHLCYVVGRHWLTNHPQTISYDRVHPESDVRLFAVLAPPENFLDLLEAIFRAGGYWRVQHDEDYLVGELNQLFLLDDLPYALTPFVRGDDRAEVLMYPKAILRDEEIAYSEAVSPAIELLRNRVYSTANQEFVGALEDYRKGHYGDVLTKCGAAFESTLKIICARNKWPFDPHKDTAKSLLTIVIQHSGTIESYFEQPLIVIATLRNRDSTAHGAGTKPRVVARHRAQYAITATAAAILLLVQECG